MCMAVFLAGASRIFSRWRVDLGIVPDHRVRRGRPAAVLPSRPTAQSSTVSLCRRVRTSPGTRNAAGARTVTRSATTRFGMD
jgi:hypothetical protein